MKIFNPIYIVAIIAAFFLWKFSQSFTHDSILFYGFAENKETEINLDHSVQVDKILVTPGEFVKKGQLLIEVSQTDFVYDIGQEKNNIDELRIKESLWQSEVEGKINILKTKHQTELTEIQDEIQEISAEKKYQESLFVDLESIKTEDRKINYDPLQEKINKLEGEKNRLTTLFEAELANLNQQKSSSKNPFLQKVKSIKDEIERNETRLKKLSLIAPTDGLIGNVHCKEAENITSFKTLITFYEPNPSLVKGFVHEDLLMQVNLNDSLLVRSTKSDKFQCKGIVSGLGSRIVEIPERLRKNPEFKTYGREVLIEIPTQNDFLQKEKVVIEFMNGLKISAITNNSENRKSMAKKPSSE